MKKKRIAAAVGVVLFVVIAAFCVNATVGGALNRGYRVMVAKDAVATESGRSLSSLLEKYRGMGASTAAS